MNSEQPKTKRYQALDLWRGLICLFVVSEHAFVALRWDSQESWVRRILVAPFDTNLGTPLFFVISGYCIASSLVSCRRRGTSPVTFLARRFWRVFPPYWVALIVFTILVLALDHASLPQIHRSPYALEINSPTDLDATQWVGNITLTETWRPRVIGSEPLVFTRIAWSLCYQEQFYVVCSIVLLLARKHLFRVLGILTIAIIGLRLILMDSGSLFRIDGTFPILWHQFAIGIAAYVILNANPSRLLRRCLLWGISLVAAAGFLFESGATTISALFGLLMLALHRFDGTWAKIQFLEPLRAVGRRSYSVYLVHLPVLILIAGGLGELGITNFWTRALLTVPLSIAGGVGFGAIFYRFVEARFLDFPPLTVPRFKREPVADGPTVSASTRAVA